MEIIVNLRIHSFCLQIIMPYRFSNMPSDWDMVSMMSLLFISGLSIYDQLLYKEGATISIPIVSGRGSERGSDGKRRYRLPEFK